jgi:PAS domain-containing protein
MNYRIFQILAYLSVCVVILFTENLFNQILSTSVEYSARNQAKINLVTAANIIQEEIKEYHGNDTTISYSDLSKILNHTALQKTSGNSSIMFAVLLDTTGKIIHDSNNSPQYEGKSLSSVLKEYNINHELLINSIMSGNDSEQNLSWLGYDGKRWVEWKVIPSTVSNYINTTDNTRYKVVLIQSISEADAMKEFSILFKFQYIYMGLIIAIFIVLIYITIKVADIKFFKNPDDKIDEIKEIFHGLSHTQEELSRYQELLTEKEIEIMHIDHDHKETSSLLSRIINTIPNIIIIRDAEDKITLLNQYAANFLKVNRHKAIGMTMEEIIEMNSDRGVCGSFGNNCVIAKRKIIETLQPSIFIEDGILYNDYTSIRVIMAPLLDHDEYFVGTVTFGYSNLDFLQEICSVLKALSDTNKLRCESQNCKDILVPAEERLLNYLMKNYSMDGRLPEILQRQFKGDVIQ